MTPQGQVQQSWFKKNWMWLAGAGCAIPMMCCGATMALGLIADEGKSTDPVVRVGEQPSARVDCGTPSPEGVDCDVKRTAGSAALEACWDLEITCNNGGVMSGHACGELADGEAASVANMAVADFSNQDGCDAPKAGAVKNLKVTLR